MAEVSFFAGAAAGVALFGLLVLTVLNQSPRIWPLPIAPNFKSLLFWSLFRALNVLAIAVAFLDFADLTMRLLPLRLVALVVASLCFALFVYAGVVLGRDNLYCGRSGLATGGLYRFSRNPQYAAAIPGYLALGIFAWSMPTVVVTSLLASVYALMALAEEPWLETSYGASYARYKSRVPRFYNVRAAAFAWQRYLSRARA